MCGETDAWDGDACKVCGFVAPPSKFQDPDVDLHKQLDLRQDQAPGAQDVNDLNADLNDRDQDGLDDNTGQPIGDENAMGADDAQPVLACPACGYEVPAGEPQTVDTADAVPGPGGAAPTGPAEGDLCPNCGQAPLETPNDLAEMGLGQQDPNADPDAAPPAEDEAAQADPRDPNAPPSDDAQEMDGDDDHPEWPDKGADDEDPDADPDEDDDEDDDEDKPAKKGFPPQKR